MDVVQRSLNKLMFTKTYSKTFKLSIWKSVLKRGITNGEILGSTLFSHGGLGQRVHSQSLSTATEEQYEVDSPHTDKKFIYTDFSKIEDERKQGCYLTKSILKPGLPSVYERPLNLDETLLQSIYKEFEEHLLDSFIFCYGQEEFSRKKYAVLNTFLNMTQTAWRKTTQSYPSNWDRSLFYKQHVITTYNRCGKFNVQIAGKPEKSFVMMSKNPLPQFTTSEEVVQSLDAETEWNEVYNPVFNFRVAEMKTINRTPFFADAPYPNPHTLFITPYKTKIDTKRLIGHGIFYTFAHAYLHALSKPQNAKGMKEIEPVSMQCVISDGRKVSFVCHQLNTLDFENDSGIKNFLWIEDEIEMFKYAHLKIPGSKKYKDATETEICLEDVNHMAFEKFLKFLLN